MCTILSYPQNEAIRIDELKILEGGNTKSNNPLDLYTQAMDNLYTQANSERNLNKGIDNLYSWIIRFKYF
jgi:hypothetical protein